MDSHRDRSPLLRQSMGRRNNPQPLKEAMFSQLQCSLDILILSPHQHNRLMFSRTLVITEPLMLLVTAQATLSQDMGSHSLMVHHHQ